MTENESRPGPASTGGHQPPQHPGYSTPWQAAPNPLFTPARAPRKKASRLAVLVSATALGAALVGGIGGAAIAGLGSTPSPSGTGTSAVANGQPVGNTASGDVSAVAAKVTPSVVQVNVTTAQGEAVGSGVILTSDGRILTNAHVVADAEGDVTITLSDGKQYKASVVGADTKADIAVLQAKDASGLTAASLGDSGKLVTGQQVVAIGSPGGLQNTVTTGIVSALNRKLDELSSGQERRSPYSRTTNESGPSYTAIQTDAPINQGNSGGALVDAQGNVIGINSALYNPASTGSIGIGFAIPINDAKKIVEQIVG
ncbi:S1C family serine protease [Amycolatopsis regifaucium]|uniref:Serine protease n=1 Tax=Amycolatopsis regifaucium TaxID=546365 RepID=A0A154MGX2_9PSEU|nr:trypsin-like peptidase domain-containing protein [Amycolatopsis regifaucium]KZB83744.1 serine protease [Amycolatopsis regifaucium]OKA06815.1 serine protease [Amycolatopsis regifaucium]SFH27329.1 putative serine protease PepD [Amycolatopsis regifaucium]